MLNLEETKIPIQIWIRNEEVVAYLCYGKNYNRLIY